MYERSIYDSMTIYDIGIILDPGSPSPKQSVWERTGYSKRDEALTHMRWLNQAYTQFPWVHFTILTRGFVPITTPFQRDALEAFLLQPGSPSWPQEDEDESESVFTREELDRIESPDSDEDEDEDEGEIDYSQHPF